MDNRIEKILTEQRSVDDVNLNAQSYVLVNNTSRPLPLNNMDTTVNQAEQADKERQNSTIYRFYGSIKPVVSNALYNENIKIHYEKELDESTNEIIFTTTPPTIKTTTVESNEIIEQNGWFGYYDNEVLESQTYDKSVNQINDNKSSLCQFIPFDPGYDRLRFIDNEGTPNYQLKITYPAYHRDDIAIVTNGSDSVTLADGIPVVRLTGVTFNDREYIAFETGINHGLRVGDFISLKNFTDLTGGELAFNDRLFKVFKLGDQFADHKNRFFVLDINPVNVGLNLGRSSIKRVVNDVESSYYMRVFSAITTEQTDYEIFPASFATNSYEDPEASFNFIKDIDLSPDIYRDNLGRPLSEVYLTITKLRNDVSNTIQSEYWSGVTNTPFWTDITPGFITTKHPNINYNIRAFGDTDYNQTYFNVINQNDTEYIGDIVEYNTEELEERGLVMCQHRINTEYRENRGDIVAPTGISTPAINLPFGPPIPANTIPSEDFDKREGYLYEPHYRIKVRSFSSYIEEGPTATTVGIPDYAIVSYSSSTVGNVMKWRDYLDIGIYDEGGRGVDYPFESGAHYIFLGNRFYWKRQDPACEAKVTLFTYYIDADNPNQQISKAIEEKLKDPKRVDYKISVAGFGFGAGLQLKVDIQIAEYFGEYNLGERDVPGGCVDINLISVRDIDNIC
jgi:hypothetical protein